MNSPRKKLVTTMIIAVWLVAILLVTGGGGGGGGAAAASEMIVYYREQMKYLKQIGCQPILRQYKVAWLLDSQDTRRDEIIIPTVVALRRCSGHNGFCGFRKMGVISEKVCKATSEREKLVRFWIRRDRGRYEGYSVKTIEHDECECQYDDGDQVLVE